MSLIYFLMGRSASGKNAIARELLNDKSLGLKSIVLYTTRPMRADEKDGVDYHFVTTDLKEKFACEGKVIEERVYHTVKGDWFYFTVDDGAFDFNGSSNLFVIGTVDSYIKYKEYFGEDKICPIFIEVDDDVLLERANERESVQDDPNLKEVKRRFEADKADYAPERLDIIRNLHRVSNNNSIDEAIKYIKENIFKK